MTNTPPGLEAKVLSNLREEGVYLPEEEYTAFVVACRDYIATNLPSHEQEVFIRGKKIENFWENLESSEFWVKLKEPDKRGSIFKLKVKLYLIERYKKGRRTVDRLETNNFNAKFVDVFLNAEYQTEERRSFCGEERYKVFCRLEKEFSVLYNDFVEAGRLIRGYAAASWKGDEAVLQQIWTEICKFKEKRKTTTVAVLYKAYLVGCELFHTDSCDLAR